MHSSIFIILALFAASTLSLLLSAFCSGSEMAFFSVSRGRILHLAREGSKAASIVQNAFSDMSSTLTSILVGNNLANVCFSSATAALSVKLFPYSDLGRTFWSAGAAIVVLYLGEFLPKLFCSSRPLRRILLLAPIFKWFAIILSPFTKAAVWVTNLFIRGGETSYRVTANDLLKILQDRKDGVKLTDLESALISRILVLRKKGEFITEESLLSVIDED
jgi:CBS domain containing-hemolysin-like protein